MSATNCGPEPIGVSLKIDCELDDGDSLTFTSDLGTEQDITPGITASYRDPDMGRDECKYVCFFTLERAVALRDWLTEQIEAEPSN